MSPAEAIEPPEDVPLVSAEQLVDGTAVGSEDLPRRYPSTKGGGVYLVALGICLIGLFVLLLGSWRGGVQWVAAGFGLATAGRAILPAKDAGMLAVRARWLDLLILGGLTVAFFLLAGSIPDQPGRP